MFLLSVLLKVISTARFEATQLTLKQVSSVLAHVAFIIIYASGGVHALAARVRGLRTRHQGKIMVLRTGYSLVRRGV